MSLLQGNPMLFIVLTSMIGLFNLLIALLMGRSLEQEYLFCFGAAAFAVFGYFTVRNWEDEIDG